MATPERRPAAILYTELRNFTRLSEALVPEKVLQLVGEFFALAAKVVSANGGQLVCVHNDAMLAIFSGADPKVFAAQALKAAQDVQRAFAPIGERWKNEFGLAAAASGGLHLGEVVLGTVGQTPVALGDAVSVAERMVHRARAGEIVISLDLMKGLGPAVQKLPANELPPLEIAKRPPIPIYGMIVEDRLDFT
jgi:class 3 adenylate cyclase